MRLASAYLASLPLLLALAGAAHGRDAATARERQLNRSLTGRGSNAGKQPSKVKTEFRPDPYHGPGSSYTTQNSEILRTTRTRRGETLRYYRIGSTGLKEVAQLHEYGNGTVIVYPNKVAGSIGARVTTSVKEGVMHLSVRFASGEAFGFDYNPRTGIVSAGGKYQMEFDKGLSPARIYHEYMNWVDRQAD